jgi:hypothetical protein
MVFEGTLASAKQRSRWVRLQVKDFAEATGLLRQNRLITEERDGRLIGLEQNVGTDQVVRLLVEHGMPVYEIAREEETLENFYLSLMKDQRSDQATLAH